MNRERLEFSISQYLDGTLPPLERDALDEVLARDGEAQKILADFQSLDLQLRSLGGANVADWDSLHARFVSALNEVEAPLAANYRIGAAARWIGGISAIAAAILVAFLFMRQPNAAAPSMPVAIAPQMQISVAPALASAGDSASLAISVGPSPQMASAAVVDDEAFVTRPSRVVIAISPESGQDAISAPF